jgi:peroxiredoxin
MNRFIFGLLVLATSATSFGITSFQLQQMNHSTPGTMYDSAAHKDGVFVLEAYFLNCPYCNDNAPNVDEMASYYASEPRVQVLDIGVDRADSQYKTWIAKHQPNHPVLKDDKRTLVRQLGTSGYPSTYVVDCKGTVRYKTSGVWSMTKESTMKDKINEILKESCND